MSKRLDVNKCSYLVFRALKTAFLFFFFQIYVIHCSADSTISIKLTVGNYCPCGRLHKYDAILSKNVTPKIHRTIILLVS